MRIDGLVKGPAGQVVAGARIEALGAARELIATAQTDAAGHFHLTGAGIVMVRTTGPDWQGSGARITTLPRLWRVPGSPRPAEVRAEITLRSCRPVAVRAFAAGRLLAAPTPETRRQIAQVWFFDQDGKVAPGAFRWQERDANPWLFLPPGQASRLQVLWTVPGFGALVCHATNAGEGIQAGAKASLGPGLTAAPDGTPELWLNEDLARSACARLEQVWAQAKADGYRLDLAAAAYHGAAREALGALHAVPLPERADPDHLEARALRSTHADAALAAALWAMEELVLQKARQDTERNRRLPRTLRLRLPDGTAAAGAQVHFQQTEHAFNFGVFVNPRSHTLSREPLGGTLWNAVKALGINQLPVPYLWSKLEPERGLRQDAAFDADFPAAALSAAGFRLKGHISVWPWHGKYPDQWGTFTPMWIYDLDPAGVQQAAYDHHRALAAYFGEHVAGFQAINEPMLSHTNAANLTLAETVALVRRSAAGLRAGGSTGPIEVNNCCLFAESVSADVREQGYERMPCEFFTDLDEAGVEYDAIGIQLGYYGGFMHSQLFQGGFPVRHILDLADLIDHYSQVGKPVYVSEVSVPSEAPPASGPYVGEWHGPWTPERQAEWIRLFYTLCYSKRLVREITWWNITDEAAFIKGGGLMSADYQPKPAYHAMQALIEGWKAAGSGSADAYGSCALAGPAGAYTVTVEHAGRRFGPFPVQFGWDEGEALTLTLHP